jgi:hypothetical protein
MMQARATECAIDTTAGAATSARRRNSHGNARRPPPLLHTNKFKPGNSIRKLNLAQQIANGLKTRGHWPPSLGRCQGAAARAARARGAREKTHQPSNGIILSS